MREISHTIFGGQIAPTFGGGLVVKNRVVAWWREIY